MPTESYVDRDVMSALQTLDRMVKVLVVKIGARRAEELLIARAEALSIAYFDASVGSRGE